LAAGPQFPTDKGLRRDSIGLVSTVVIGVASTAPAYSLAATLGFVVTGVGLQSPVIMVLAFVPKDTTAEKIGDPPSKAGLNSLSDVNPPADPAQSQSTAAPGARSAAVIPPGSTPPGAPTPASTPASTPAAPPASSPPSSAGG